MIPRLFCVIINMQSCHEEECTVKQWMALMLILALLIPGAALAQEAGEENPSTVLVVYFSTRARTTTWAWWRRATPRSWPA